MKILTTMHVGRTVLMPTGLSTASTSPDMIVKSRSTEQAKDAAYVS